MSCTSISFYFSFFFLPLDSFSLIPKIKYNNLYHFFYVIVTASLYAVSKSIGFNWYRISQLAFDLILDGISVYFYVTTIIDTVPLKIKCLLFMTSCASRGSNSAFFIDPTTSSSTTSTFLCVLSCSHIGNFFNSSYFDYMI